jgi:hypothetical protein
VNLVGADLPARAIDQLVDLVGELVDPGTRPAPPLPGVTGAIALGDVVGDRLVAAAASSAAPRSVPTRSNASRISMTFSALFTDTS